MSARGGRGFGRVRPRVVDLRAPIRLELEPRAAVETPTARATRRYETLAFSLLVGLTVGIALALIMWGVYA